MGKLEFFAYKCDNKYEKTAERGIIFNDETLNIKWPYTQLEDYIISEKDLNNIAFKNIELFTTKEFNK